MEKIYKYCGNVEMDVLEFIECLLMDVKGIKILERNDIKNYDMLFDQDVKVVVIMRKLDMREKRRMMNSNNNHNVSRLPYQIANPNGTWKGDSKYLSSNQ